MHLLDGQGEQGIEADTAAAIEVGVHKYDGGGTHMEEATSGTENVVVPSNERPPATNVGGVQLCHFKQQGPTQRPLSVVRKWL